MALTDGGLRQLLPHFVLRDPVKNVHTDVTISAIYVCNPGSSAPKRNTHFRMLFDASLARLSIKK